MTEYSFQQYIKKPRVLTACRLDKEVVEKLEKIVKATKLNRAQVLEAIIVEYVTKQP